MTSSPVTSRTADPREVVIGAVEALGRTDLETFFATMADDITWEVIGGDFLPTDGRFVGKKAVTEEFFGAVGGAFEMGTFDLAILHTFVEGPTVIVEWLLKAKSARGSDYENNYCIIFTVDDDGLITTVREYCDTAYTRRVLVD